MAMKQEIHLDRGTLMLGPVHPRGEQALRKLMENAATELRATVLGPVSLTEPAARTFQIDASWDTEFGRIVFRRMTAAAMEIAEADSKIEWGGP